MKNPVAFFRDASVAHVQKYVASRAATEVMESCTYSYKTDAVYETRLLSATPIGNGNYKVVEIKNTTLLSATAVGESEGEYADLQQSKTERGNMTLAGVLLEMERYEAQEDYTGVTLAFAEMPQIKDFVFSRIVPDNHYTDVARRLGALPETPSNENAPGLNGSLHA